MSRFIAMALQEDLLAVRRAHSDWGPRKVLRYLHRRRPPQPWPAISTVDELIRRHGLLRRRRRPRRTSRAVGAVSAATIPNAVWRDHTHRLASS